MMAAIIGHLGLLAMNLTRIVTGVEMTYLQYVACIQLSQLEKDVLTSVADSAIPLCCNPRSIARGTLRAMATSIVGILATSMECWMHSFCLCPVLFLFYSCISLFGSGRSLSRTIAAEQGVVAISPIYPSLLESCCSAPFVRPVVCHRTPSFESAGREMV